MSINAIRIGVAGWVYDDWKGIVYPPGTRGVDPLRYMASFFDVIEVNSSFYRPPTEGMCQAWLEKTGSNERFRFTIKLWQRFTHERKPIDIQKDTDDFKRGVGIILSEGRLGALLVQFPWSFRNTAPNRERLRALFDSFSEYPIALEVRHSSWDIPDFYDFLRQHDVAFCNIDQPIFRNSIPPTATFTSRVGYFRFHGRNRENWFSDDAGRDERYDYLYDDKELDPWVAKIIEVSEQSDETFVITNNHYRGQAVCNALQLKAKLTGEQVEVPAHLMDSFPQLQTIARPDKPVQQRLF